MLRFCSGITRGGKTKFVVNEVIDELRFGKRPIICSLALRLDPWVNSKGVPYEGLVHGLQRKFGQSFNVRGRVFFLTDEQVHEFWNWRLRVGGTELEQMPQPDKRNWEFDGAIWQPAFYVVDEAHLHFRKKDWDKIGDSGLAWASQNARAGDDCWLITQRAELVAKPFRDQSAECYWMVNHIHRRIGMFRGLKRISYEVHLNTPPSAGDPPLSGGTLEFRDDWLNGVYDTAAGGRVVGGNADLGTHAKGLHLGWGGVMAVGAMVAIALILVGCMAGARKVSKAAFAAVGPRPHPAVAVSTQAVASVLPRALISSGSGVAVPAKSGHAVTEPEVWLTGRLGNRIYFSDGTDVLGRQVIVVPGGLMVDGRRYVWKQRNRERELRGE